MTRPVPARALLDVVADFRAEVARQATSAALDIVGAVLEARRVSEMRSPSLVLSRATTTTRRGSASPSEQSPAQTEKRAHAVANPTTAEAVEPAGARGKSRSLAREMILETLVQTMISVPTVDAQFMKRHGPRGFVPATLKVFGRFEAALNVAALQLSKLYPNGRPEDRLAKLQHRPGSSLRDGAEPAGGAGRRRDREIEA